MNTAMECLIIEILTEPFEMDGKWWRSVKWISWGCRGNATIPFQSKSLAFDCRVKHKFRKENEPIKPFYNELILAALYETTPKGLR